jgi:cysteine-rich repeat protein
VQTAAAHTGDDHPISSEKLKLQWDAVNAKKNKFQYKTKGQIEINDLSVDPSTVTSSITVRGTGVDDGNSGVIQLSPLSWSAIGTKGWKYNADAGYYLGGGIKGIKIMTHAKGGRLQIKAKGQYWAYVLSQPQSTIEITLNIGESIYCAQYGSTPSELTRNEGTAASGKVQGKVSAVIMGGECPSVCGNGQLELGEECDDGNADDEDTCNNSCEGCDPLEVDYDSTFEAIQALIFDGVYGCSADICHGTALSGGLDLRDGTSYSQLVSVPSPNWSGNPLRVFPGDQDPSLLYSKLAHLTLGAPTIPSTGTAMPSGANPALTTDHLEAIRLWIRGGAPEDVVVAGTPELLGTCLPSASPNKIPKPDAPAPSVGFQLTQPGWPLPAEDERELCVVSYYDLSAVIPPAFKIPCTGDSGEVNQPEDECFAYNDQFLAQDPQSHHSIIHIYVGDYDQTHSGWGSWRCYLGDDAGDPCDPLNLNADCGGGGICGGDDVEGIACLSAGGYGPPDYSQFGNTAPTFGGSQESTSQTSYPVGVYATLPIKGLVVWNSHAFNLTEYPMALEAWLNMEYTSDLTYPVRALFDTKNIFLQNVAPFDSTEYCDTHTFSGTDTINLFEISSHTHRYGKRWRYYQSPQTPCPSYVGCTPGDPGDIFYESFQYSDPVYIQYDPPALYPFTGDVADRTIKYCSLYDNGATDPSEVKRQSQSPCPPIGPCGGFGTGGPCNNSAVKCLGGVNQGQLCAGNDANCPGSVCDACPLLGGVTTADEMFIPIGSYYRTP